jgi:DNA recombination protein RmuC
MSIDLLTLAAVLIFGAFIGALVGWLSTRPAHSRLNAELDKERALHGERLKTYQDAETRFREAFESLSARALNDNNEAFLQLAETRLQQTRTEANADIDAKKKAIEDLLAPMAQAIERVDTEIKGAERRRIQEGASLLQRVASLDAVGRELQGETRRLVDALKRPGVRGRWGEIQLKRVVELAGMLEHCDFEEQRTLDGNDRRVRPDVIIQLPGGKHIVVDAKVPLDAYLRALEAPDETTRLALLVDHARQVRTHLGQLGAKSYYTDVPLSPEFVVMFLPGEMFFSAALEQDPSLIEFGVERQVIPASPTTLIALLKAVSYGWQQEAMEENARKISELGRHLYDAVRVMATHMDDMGTNLGRSLDSYNKAIGSLESNVLVKARRFKELQSASAAAEEIPAIEVISRVPRRLQARELTDGLPFEPAVDHEDPKRV